MPANKKLDKIPISNKIYDISKQLIEDITIDNMHTISEELMKLEHIVRSLSTIDEFVRSCRYGIKIEKKDDITKEKANPDNTMFLLSMLNMLNLKKENKDDDNILLKMIEIQQQNVQQNNQLTLESINKMVTSLYDSINPDIIKDE